MRAKRLLVALAVLGIVPACGGSGGGAPADPVGTITSSIPQAGTGCIDFDTGVISNSGAGWDMSYGTLQFNGATGGGRTISDLGHVSGLGAIKTIPAAGWVASLSAVVGHGYVLHDTTTGLYWRFYLDDWMYSAIDDSVVGVIIKWTAMP
jgi:hypothetical protein